MITPHQPQFTVFSGAFVSEQHKADVVVCEVLKSKFAPTWRWFAALTAFATVVVVLTVLHYRLDHYGSLPIEPSMTDGFLIVDPARM
jgi:hypothetical protein